MIVVEEFIPLVENTKELFFENIPRIANRNVDIDGTLQDGSISILFQQAGGTPSIATPDVPIGHINAAYVRSHFDSMEVGVPDAPHADEMVLCLVMTIGPRIHDRVGGLKASAIVGKDGLR